MFLKYKLKNFDFPSQNEISRAYYKQPKNNF